MRPTAVDQELIQDLLAAHERVASQLADLIVRTVALGGLEGVTNAQLLEVIYSHIPEVVWNAFYSDLIVRLADSGYLETKKEVRHNISGHRQLQRCWRIPKHSV